MTAIASEQNARAVAEAAARVSYGRLVALLASHTRDIANAEDALSDAFAAALSTWPQRGVPTNPEAWLFTAARRNLSHGFRHQRVVSLAEEDLLRRVEERVNAAWSAGSDERLNLLFVCAHPAIDEQIRTPLMLQTVLGLDAQAIAAAFLVAPATMGQRLVRAKTKIRDAGVPFQVPEPAELPERLHDVLRAIYVAFGAGWDDLASGRGLAEEAIFLGRTMVALLPYEPEAKGLLALMLYCHARRDARRGPDGAFIPLAQQDPARWHRASIVEAEQLLTAAAAAQRFGRFQCEAAIQSVHAQRAITGVLQHHAVLALYDLLLAHAPSVGAAVARAAALLDAADPAAAARALDALPSSDVANYQPFWVTRARLAEHRGLNADAIQYTERALALSDEPQVRAFLLTRLSALRSL
jgi:RNA polymerase sigma-70 factor (ECF subfamily)